MAGYPRKITRTNIGPTFENTKKIGNPKKELSADTVNLLAWQLAGLNGPAARGLVKASYSGGVVEVLYQWFAWDANQALSSMTFTEGATGDFTWALPAATALDKDGNTVQIDLIGGLYIPYGTVLRAGVFDVDSGGSSGTLKVYNTTSGALANPDSGFIAVFF